MLYYPTPLCVYWIKKWVYKKEQRRAGKTEVNWTGIHADEKVSGALYLFIHFSFFTFSWSRSPCWFFFLIDKKYKPILEHKLSYAGEPNKDIWHANLIHPSNSEMRSQTLAQWSFWSYLLTKTWCPEKMAIQRYSWSKCLLDNCIDCDAEITLID